MALNETPREQLTFACNYRNVQLPQVGNPHVVQTSSTHQPQTDSARLPF